MIKLKQLYGSLTLSELKQEIESIKEIQKNKIKCFSVLMSVYKKDSANDLVKTFASIFRNSILPSQIVIVEDGPLTSELYLVIRSIKECWPNRIDIITLKQNVGLGLALNVGLKSVLNDIVARVDSDDINADQRFEKEYMVMQKHSNFVLVGSFVQEFDNKYTLMSKRIVPVKSEDICKFGKFRNPFNHPSVMFRKKIVQDAGGYDEIRGFEDYHLWSRLLVKNYQTYNIPNTLVYMRTGNGLYNRRGGLSYLKRYISLRNFQHKIGWINILQYVQSILAMSITSIVPAHARKSIYRKLLRRE